MAERTNKVSPVKAISKQALQQVDELRKAVRAFNEKRREVLKRDPEAIDRLQKPMSLKEERAKFLSSPASERKIQVKRIRAFGQKGAEKLVENVFGVKVTEWELKDVKELTRRRNIRAAAKKKRIPTDYKKGLDDPAVVAQTKPKDFDFSMMDKRAFDRYKRTAEKQASQANQMRRDEIYKQNWMGAATAYMGEYGQRLNELVARVPAGKLVQILLQNAETKIEFFYNTAATYEIFSRICRKLSEHMEVPKDIWNPDVVNEWSESDGDNEAEF